jgi:origin recognition complex subunit 1
LFSLEKFSIFERRTKLLVAEDEFEEATDRLHVSAVPEKLPGREEEFCELYGLLEAAIEEGSGTCICKKMIFWMIF